MSVAVFSIKHHTGEVEEFSIQLQPEWAPRGVERFLAMVKDEYFTDVAFHRVIPGFMAQFGIAADPKVYAKYGTKEIQDDPVKQSNTRGRITFANRGPNTRTAQMFINYADNGSNLDSQHFAPFGEVMGDGMKVVDKIYGEYGESHGPDAQELKRLGKAYSDTFPKLSIIKSVALK